MRSTNRTRMAQLRAAPHHERAGAARLESQPQTRLSDHAGGQPAVRAKAEIRYDHRFQPRLESVSELARTMVLTGVDQLWVADLTYIRLSEEFVFLAVILDAYSRRVIGWALDRTLEGKLTLAALQMALSRRIVQTGLVHHSDRGTQYASNEYTDLLKANAIAISMSRKGNPWDNATCESFIKTLKYEEVLRNEYRDLHEAKASIGEFLEKLYNERRLHSALGYLPPAEFEANLAAGRNELAATQRLSI